MLTSHALQLSDVSHVTSLRERLGRAAASLKLIGLFSALDVIVYGGDHVNGWIALALGVVVFFSAFPLGKRLRSGKTWAARLVALWLIVYLLASSPGSLRSWRAGVGFFSVIGLLLMYLPVYFGVRGLLALRAYRRRPSTTPTASSLTSNPWEDGSPGSRRHRTFRSKWSLRAYSFVLAAPLVWLFVFASSLNRPVPSISDAAELLGRRVFDFLFGVAVWLLMVYLYRRGRRHALLPGNALLKRDPRDVVLYLRSFLDDRATKIRARPNDGRIFPERFMKISFEELVTDHLWRYGPVVAIGDPRARDKLVPLGAARHFEPDDAWQEKATDLMRQSRIIVAVAGRSEGLIWELNTILRVGLQSKLVLLLPPVKEQDLAARWEAMAQQVSW